MSRDPATIEQWADNLLIHECAHDFSGDHLTMVYINACTRLGAKLKRFGRVALRWERVVTGLEDELAIACDKQGR